MTGELSPPIYFMKVVFVSYNLQSGYSSPELWLERIKTFAALMESLACYCEVSYVKQFGYNGVLSRNNVDYIFLRSNKRKPYFPRQVNDAVKELKPDIVIVSGIRSPLQIIQLRLRLGKNTIIIGRHHADRPPTGIRRILQRWADKCVNAYLFTSIGNAQEWFDARIIPRDKTIYELMEASTGLTRLDRPQSLENTGMNGDPNFLWVGRLNATKDPLTVLEGFEKYLETNDAAKLYMIFDVEELLPEVNEIIRRSAALSKAVILKGKVNNTELAAWYSAADFYISGSHSEGGSYALLEAMACGCIPIVTSIPATLKMTENGKYAVIFDPGNADDLAKKLFRLSSIDKGALSSSVENYFKKELSNSSIAEKLFNYCKKLFAK